MKKNVASQVIGAQMNSKTDGSAVTTGTTTVYVTGDGGTQAAGSVGSGACTHEGQGFWTYAPAQAETNYDHVAFTFTNTNAVAVTVQVYPSFPQTGDSYARIGAPVGASISADVAGVQSDTNDIQTRLPAALVSGRMDSNMQAAANGVITAAVIADGAIDAATFAAGAIDAAAIAADAIDDSAIAADVTAVIAAAVWNAATATYGAAGSYGLLVETNLDAAVSTRASQTSVDTVDDFLDTEVAAILAAVDTEVAAIKAKTDNLPASPAATGDIPTTAQIADKVLGRNLAGGADGTRTVQDALRALRNKSTIAAGTLTVYQEDDTTSAWTATVTTAAGDPLSGIDPA